ncbi:MAG TPA: flavin reductase family protein [Firmicutes bacterium]|nr:flavin reductase family protein [Bacillota bacterium]
MSKVLLKNQPLVVPGAVVLVSAGTMDGPHDATTIAWASNMASEPPAAAIGVRQSRYIYGLIKEHKAFVINLPPSSKLWELDYCGTVSGRDTDKFAATHLTPVPAEKVKAVMVAEFPVNLECEVFSVVPAGSHDIFVARIVAIHAEEEVLDASGRLDQLKMGGVAYGAGTYFSLGKALGRHGLSQQVKK